MEIALESIRPSLSANPNQEQIEAAMRILKVRRDIMERLCAANEYRAHILRSEATVEECEERMGQMGLTSWQKKGLEGRIAEAQAAIGNAQQQIRQGELEIWVLQAALCP